MRIGRHLRTALERVRGLTRDLVRNTDANVAMMFAISLIPVTIAAGAGLDLSRAMIVKSNLTEALDASALAVASPSVADADVQTAAQAYFNANYKVDSSYGSLPAVHATRTGQTVNVTTSVQMPTTLMGVAGIHTVTVTAASTVVWGQTKLWVSLVLDNTGSMCQTDTNPNANAPCTNPPSNSKIAALKSATHQLLSMLQTAAANPDDIKVAIIPFSKTVNVGTGLAGSTWIDWTDWAAAPPGGVPSTSVGPGSACPWSTGTNGFRCTTDDANGSSNTNTIPSDGRICPSVHSTDSSTGLGGHYYNGCYTSVATKTLTTTQTDTTPITIKQTCSQTGSGTITCNNNSGYPSNGSTSSNTTTATTNGYTGDSGPTTTSNTATNSTSDGTKNCTGQGASKKCTWTRTIAQTKTDTTVTKTGAAPFNHTWVVNDHATWTGCLMDRAQSYDVDTTTPTSATTNFPAENTTSCVPSTLAGLSSNWTTLSNEVDAMNPTGSTNQTIGLAWGMQAQTSGDPLNSGSLPTNTSRFIILVSDGLNTQDRFGGDGSNQSTVVDGRMAAACTNAKTAGFIIYTIFVDLGGTQGNSTVLQNCATDSSKYFDLTTTGAIVTTLSQIGQQITNLRVAQ
jgi:Flp pilus assembly protein TadG